MHHNAARPPNFPVRLKKILWEARSTIIVVVLYENQFETLKESQQHEGT
jgi:hypothetical protein